jgi:putative membrane protein
MTRLILVGILLLLSLAFFLQNQEQEVTLRYFFGMLDLVVSSLGTWAY